MRSPIAPWRICHLIGHRRQMYDAGRYTDRRGRWRTRWHSRCIRCGTSDGGEVFREGILEHLTVWNLMRACRRRREALRNWIWQECDDCHKPSVRFGRSIGYHSKCDLIPF